MATSPATSPNTSPNTTKRLNNVNSIQALKFTYPLLSYKCCGITIRFGCLKTQVDHMFKRWLKDWTLNMLFRRNSLQNQSLWKSLKSHMKRTMRRRCNRTIPIYNARFISFPFVPSRLYQHSPHQKRKIIRIDRRTPGNSSSLVVSVAVLGVAGYGYIWWKGLSFSDIMFVTKHNMEKAVADLTTKLQHASDVIDPEASLHVV
ncbi:hypothetical protein P8452_15823 [Trifolium repens]|nr:hypothetical protein P8452_15823 [Trifolium repens]